MTTPTLRPLSTLVVDNSRDAADSLADLLRLYGHQAAATYSGSQAVAVLGDRPVDVVLIDPAMPGLVGNALLRRVAAASPRKRPFVVVTTGSSDDHDRDDWRAAGADLVLMKPLPEGLVGGLLRRIRHFLDTLGPPTDEPGIAGPAGGTDARCDIRSSPPRRLPGKVSS
ncbi:response regulator [Limnoglobus roseus]|uniref:Response regulator n=1 Tax=Limnoglobus roseus TaxID=2598579 RepID=A0A5C1AND2_9BACT|nr:response regulator [Limnoglobus roseus]QEL20500.1 response regulator [Limnoglobus roseus]